MQIQELLRKSPFSSVNHFDSVTGTTLALDVQAQAGLQMLFNSRATNLALAYQFLDTDWDEKAAIVDPIELVTYVSQFVDPTKNSLYSAWVLDQYEKKRIDQGDFPQVRVLLNLFKATGKDASTLGSFASMNDLYLFVQGEHQAMFSINKSVKETLANAGVQFLGVHEHSAAQYSVLISQEDSESALGSILKDRAITGRDYGDFSHAVVVKSLNGESYHFQEDFPEVIYRSDSTEVEFKALPVDAQRLFYYSWACAGLQSPLRDYFSTDVTTARASLPGLRSSMLEISPDSKSFGCQELYFQLLDDHEHAKHLLHSRVWNVRQLCGMVQNPGFGAAVFPAIIESLTIEYIEGDSEGLPDNQRVALDTRSHELAEAYPSEILTRIARARLASPVPVTDAELGLIADVVIRSDGAGDILSAMSADQVKQITPMLLNQINSAGYLSMIQISSELCRQPGAADLHREFAGMQCAIVCNNPHNSADVRKLFGRSTDHFANLIARGKVDADLVSTVFESTTARDNPKIHSALIKSVAIDVDRRIELVSESADVGLLKSLAKKSAPIELRHAIEARLHSLLPEGQGDTEKTVARFAVSENNNFLEKNSTNQNNKVLEFNHDENNHQLSTLASEQLMAIVENLEQKNRPGNTQ